MYLVYEVEDGAGQYLEPGQGPPLEERSGGKPQPQP